MAASENKTSLFRPNMQWLVLVAPSCLIYGKAPVHTQDGNVPWSVCDDLTIAEKCHIVSWVYCSYLFPLLPAVLWQSTLLSLDRQLWQGLITYCTVYQDNNQHLAHNIAEAAKTSVVKHLWYMTEQLSVFALFNQSYHSTSIVNWLSSFVRYSTCQNKSAAIAWPARQANLPGRQRSLLKSCCWFFGTLLCADLGRPTVLPWMPRQTPGIL